MKLRVDGASPIARWTRIRIRPSRSERGLKLDGCDAKKASHRHQDMTAGTGTNPGIGVLSCVLGVVSLVEGVAIWRGHSLRLRKSVLRQYRWGADRFRRNTTLAMIPGGVWFLTGGLAFLRDWPGPATTFLVVSSVAALMLTFWLMVSPPRWAKPRWLVLEEQAGFPSLEAPLPPRRITMWYRMRAWLVLLAVVALAAVAVAFVANTVWGIVSAGLFGLGGVIAYQAQRRNEGTARKRQEH